MSETPRGSWASSIFDLKQSQADVQLPNLFDRVSQEDIDRNNEIQRQQHRQDTMFALYPTQDEVKYDQKQIFCFFFQTFSWREPLTFSLLFGASSLPFSMWRFLADKNIGLDKTKNLCIKL